MEKSEENLFIKKLEKETNMSQEERILKHLQRGNAITQASAIIHFRCYRLSARIYGLRRKGHNIISNLIEKNGHRFAEYRLAGE